VVARPVHRGGAWCSLVDIARHLADGTPGSGISRAERRYQIGSSAWSPWAAADATGEFDLSGVAQDQTVSVEVRTYDAVGNVSSSGTATLTIRDTAPPSPDADGELIDQSDDYVSGTGHSPLTLQAEDLGSGVKSISLLIDGTYRGTVTPTCDEGTS
jgi:hypothetical protein